MYFDSSQDYEESVNYHGEDLSESIYVDMRGSTRSMGTFSSGVNAEQPGVEGRPKQEGGYKYSGNVSQSPQGEGRATQSADNTLLDERLSPTSLPGLGSPRFPEDNHPSFVSDYVAFGRSKQDLRSSRTGKITHKSEVVAQFAREQERLTSELQSAHNQIIILENHKTEAFIRIQGLERDKKTLEEKCRQMTREIHEIRKIEEIVGDRSTFQSKLQSFQAQKDEFIKEIASLRQENSQKLSKITDLTASEKHLRDQLNQKYEETHNLKKERLKLLKEIDDFQRIRSNFEKELKGNVAETEKFKAKCKELELTLQSYEEQGDLERKIEKLERENREKDKKIREFEEKFREKRTGRNKSEGKKRDNSENRGKSPHSRRVLHEIMDILGVSHRKELLPRLKSLLTSQSASEFVTNMQNMVKKYSPPGSFPMFPTERQVATWVERLIGEYLALRKGGEVLNSLVNRLGIGRYGDLTEAIDRLIAENRELRGNRGYL